MKQDFVGHAEFIRKLSKKIHSDEKKLVDLINMNLAVEFHSVMNSVFNEQSEEYENF